jgi:hypothetical protein
MDARDWTTEFPRSDPWCDGTDATLSLFSYVSYPLHPPSSCSSFLAIVLFLVFKNIIIFENEKHFQNNKKTNQKCMNRALDHSKHVAPEPLRHSAESGESKTVFLLLPRRQKQTTRQNEQKVEEEDCVFKSRAWIILILKTDQNHHDTATCLERSLAV